jgi:hypothetical protein
MSENSGGKDALYNLPRQRAELITNVLTNGLKSAEELIQTRKPFLQSEDQILRPFISAIPLDSLTSYNKQVDSVFYRGIESIFPVLAERQKDNRFLKLSIKTLTQRMNSSFLVIWERKKEEEFGSRKQVLPKDFRYLIFPKQLWNEYLRNRTLTNLPKTPIKVVENLVKKTIQGIELQVPNYEDSIREVLRELNCPLAVHAVRLPTQED